MQNLLGEHGEAPQPGVAVEATETLRKVLDEIDVTVFAFGPEGALRIVNRTGEQLLCQSAERLLARTAAELRLAEALIAAVQSLTFRARQAARRTASHGYPPT